MTPDDQSHLTRRDWERIDEMHTDVKHIKRHIDANVEHQAAFDERLNEHSKEIHTAKAGVRLLKYVFSGGALVWIGERIMKGLF